jgi:adenine-specific DNA-methyltransferase
MSPNAAVAELVARTRTRAGSDDPAAIRRAFRHVLAHLPVDPDDPAWRDGIDVVGTAYERLLPGAVRRTRGQFFTPIWAGEVMARWLATEPVKLLLDPGCGSGSLLIPAAQSQSRRTTRLLGLDIDPIAIDMCRANRSLRGIERLEVRQADFLLDELGESPDAVICNPPYSRHHAIPPEQKRAIHDGFRQRLGLSLSRLAGLHVLFLVRALEVGADDARLAFITPSDWLDVGYGDKVKELLLGQAHVEALILLDGNTLFFDGVLTTAAITLMRKGPGESTATQVIRLGADLPAPSRVIADLRSTAPGEELSLAAGAKWARPQRPRRRGKRLGDLARVRRGIATGRNGFFVLSESRRRALRLPLSAVRPCISSPRTFDGNELRSEDLERFGPDVPRWVLDVRDPKAEIGAGAVARYLTEGRELGVSDGYLASRRSPWFALERRGDCPILFSYFNRARPRFVRNFAGAIPLNNWLIVEPHEGVDADELFALLRSRTVMRRLGENCRLYGSGLWKLEPSELEALRLQ